MIKQLKFVSVPVSDQQRALDFYTKKLGFSILTDQQMGPGMRWIELALNGGSGIALFTPPGHESRIGTFSGLSFEADNVEKTYQELVQRGVEFTQAPKKEGWGTSAMFRDPDGNTFVLSSR